MDSREFGNDMDAAYQDILNEFDLTLGGVKGLIVTWSNFRGHLEG
jgi:hypothetical protein